MVVLVHSKAQRELFKGYHLNTFKIYSNEITDKAEAHRRSICI
jgi:hypothetical protein